MEQEQVEERKAKVTKMRSILRDALIVAPSMLKLFIIVLFALERSEPRIEKLSQEELFWATDGGRKYVRHTYFVQTNLLLTTW